MHDKDGEAKRLRMAVSADGGQQFDKHEARRTRLGTVVIRPAAWSRSRSLVVRAGAGRVSDAGGGRGSEDILVRNTKKKKKRLGRSSAGMCVHVRWPHGTVPASKPREKAKTAGNFCFNRKRRA